MTEPHKALIAIGSNIRQNEHTEKAMALIEQNFMDVKFSSALWTKPIGLDSDMFLNAIASFATAHDSDRTTRILKEIEEECGNTKALRKEGVVCMDLDLLMFDGERLHGDDWERPYIKVLLDELGLENEACKSSVCRR